ncbi:hypothetical protein ACJJID_00250 (plasmid) [Microbulbifer sp. CnH-101-G]|uniref:hypothetical protein n=1 Tax=Microbulbifer sp. CnH-101-G TaxID=3243393 RepID=UPI00403937A2
MATKKKLVKRELILAKIESAYGTDAAPTGADNAILIENLGWSFSGARMAERNPITPTLGKLQGVFAGTLMEMTFDVEIKGSGTAGTPPEMAPLLRACGLAETITATTSVAYQPASDTHESATLYFHEDGSLYKLTGVRGTFSAALTTGEVGKISFTLTGHVSRPTDAALPVASYSAVVPPPAINMPFKVGSFNAVISALSLEIGNQIATPPNIAAENGYGDVSITDREVTGSFDPESTLVSENDWVGDWQDGNAQAIETGTVGHLAGNQYSLSIPQAWYKEVGPGARDGLRTYEMNFGAAGGDDAFTLTFT